MACCSWCREFIRGDPVPIDHSTFHAACAQLYREWLRELKRLSDEEIRKHQN